MIYVNRTTAEYVQTEDGYHVRRIQLTKVQKDALKAADVPKRDPQWRPTVSQPKYPPADWIELANGSLDALIASEPDHRYWRVIGDAVVEMTQAEKDGPFLEHKRRRITAIDVRTQELIAAGFTYAGSVFSLSDNAQRKLQSLKEASAVQTYPVVLAQKDDLQPPYSATDETALLALTDKGLQRILDEVAAGQALKTAIQQATTQSEIDVVVDTR